MSNSISISSAIVDQIHNDKVNENKPQPKINHSENQNESNFISLSDLSDELISNLLGLSVEVLLKTENRNEDQKSICVKGKIFSILKANNLLILIRKDEKEQNSIISYILNIEQISSIKLITEKFDVDFAEVSNPNLDKIFDNEKKILELDSLLRNSELGKINSKEPQKNFQKGHTIYEKLCKLILLDELDAYIEEPFNIENLYCDNDYTKNRLKRMIESCLK